MVLSGEMPDPGKSETGNTAERETVALCGPNDLAAVLNGEAATGAGEKRFWMPEKSFRAALGT
jgi:hypothetical protein